MELSNEEKAIEFATSCDGKIISFAHLAALQMGAWKDEQFKEEKKELLGLVKMLPVNERNYSIIEDLKEMLQ